MFSGTTAKARFDCNISAISTHSLGAPATSAFNLLPYHSSSQQVSPSTGSPEPRHRGWRWDRPGCVPDGKTHHLSRRQHGWRSDLWAPESDSVVSKSPPTGRDCRETRRAVYRVYRKVPNAWNRAWRTESVQYFMTKAALLFL